MCFTLVGLSRNHRTYQILSLMNLLLASFSITITIYYFYIHLVSKYLYPGNIICELFLFIFVYNPKLKFMYLQFTCYLCVKVKSNYVINSKKKSIYTTLIWSLINSILISLTTPPFTLLTINTTFSGFIICLYLTIKIHLIDLNDLNKDFFDLLSWRCFCTYLYKFDIKFFGLICCPFTIDFT